MITCQINNQSLVTVYDEVVADSVEYLTASFTFSDDWDGYSKTVIFSNYSNNKVLVVTLIDGDSLYLGNNTCYVPHEVIESPGFSISVFGIKNESVITTDEKNIVVRESGYKRGEVPEEPTPTDVERIIGIATSAKNIADSVREDADAGLFKGEKGDKGDAGEQGPQGERGETGPQGPQGIPGVSPVTDEHFNKNSLNAQSGKAVNEAVENKADNDGDYPELKAGLANNLISVVTENDQEPYNFRTSGGSLNIGSRKVEEIVGGTICWNQLIDLVSGPAIIRRSGNQSTGDPVIYFTSSNGLCTITMEPFSDILGGGRTSYIINKNIRFISNHKYLLYNTLDSMGLLYYLTDQEDSSNIWSWGTNLYNNKVFTVPNGKDGLYKIGFNYLGGSNDTKKTSSGYIQLFDLTNMFGSIIADYIYSLETANPGSGLMYFKNLFPLNYYSYNSGTLLSVKTSAITMTGFNIFKNDVLSGTYNKYTNQLSSNDRKIFLDFLKKIQKLNKVLYYRVGISDKSTSSGSAPVGRITLFNSGTAIKYISPNNSFSLSDVDLDSVTNVVLYGRNSGVSGTHLETTFSDICFSVQWDGERNGEYEPYHEASYPLSDVELYGFPTLDSNNNLYYDGDVYSNDGKIIRNYIKVKGSDLDTAWFAIYNAEHHILGMTIRNKHKNDLGKCLCDSKYIYTGATSGPINTLSNDLTYCEYNVSDAAWVVYLRDDSCSTIEEFREAIENIYFIYKLQTPIIEIENILSYTNPQWVDDWGTEEFVDEREVQIPVGHNTNYDVNLKSKLEMAPDSPDDDGVYVVKQQNGINKYALLSNFLPNYHDDTKQNNWRKVVDIMLTQDSSRSLIISQDLNGNTFELSQARVYLYIPKDSTLSQSNQNGYFNFAYDQDGNNSYLYNRFGAIDIQSQTNDNYFMIEYKALNAQVPAYINLSKIYPNAPDTDQPFRAPVNNQTYVDRYGTTFGNKVIAFVISLNANYLRSGTRIIIEGIDKS